VADAHAFCATDLAAFSRAFGAAAGARRIVFRGISQDREFSGDVHVKCALGVAAHWILTRNLNAEFTPIDQLGTSQQKIAGDAFYHRQRLKIDASNGSLKQAG
jgi:hypothetical protein